MKNILIITAGFIAGFTIVIYLLNSALNMPDVYFSYSTKECTKVVNYGTMYTCDNLPEKYNHIWVK